MKKFTQKLVNLAPALAACLVAVAAMEANSAATLFFHQPEAPKGLDKFRRLK